MYIYTISNKRMKQLPFVLLIFCFSINLVACQKEVKSQILGSALSVKKDGGQIEAITSATITSRAVCRAIAEAQKKLK